ncbi:MAG TPA: hypothetical protein VFO19_20195 [Vicinamibacterales bacterium]|nr:hypothetical protein [Vicinamibacterales bacterium]
MSLRRPLLVTLVLVAAAADPAAIVPQFVKPPTVREVFRRYVKGAYNLEPSLLRLGARQIAAELDAVANAWLDEVATLYKGPDRDLRDARLRTRERAGWKVAAFAIEAVYITASPGTSVISRPADFAAIIEIGRKSLQPTSPASPFYEHWYHAVIATAEMLQSPEVVKKTADQALEYLDDLDRRDRDALAAGYVRGAISRFQLRPRFLLARAFAADMTTSPLTNAAPGVPGSVLNDATKRYLAAMEHDEVRGEAGLRLAFMELRAGRQEQGLQRLAQAEPRLDDVNLRYVAHLVRGREYFSMERWDDAEAAFRAALEIAPDAQSANLGLASVRFVQRDAADADARTDRLLTRPRRVYDPWWLYWLGDGRLSSQIIERMRSDLQ